MRRVLRVWVGLQLVLGLESRGVGPGRSSLLTAAVKMIDLVKKIAPPGHPAGLSHDIARTQQATTPENPSSASKEVKKYEKACQLEDCKAWRKHQRTALCSPPNVKRGLLQVALLRCVAGDSHTLVTERASRQAVQSRIDRQK